MSDKRHKKIGDPFDCLIEECAEVIQAVVKIRRFGPIGHADKPLRAGLRTTNTEDLLAEMDDCEARIKEVRSIIGKL